MKRIIAMLLILAALLCLPACNREGKEPDVGEKQDPAQLAQDRYVVYMESTDSCVWVADLQTGEKACLFEGGLLPAVNMSFLINPQTGDITYFRNREDTLGTAFGVELCRWKLFSDEAPQVLAVGDKAPKFLYFGGKRNVILYPGEEIGRSFVGDTLLVSTGQLVSDRAAMSPNGMFLAYETDSGVFMLDNPLNKKDMLLGVSRLLSLTNGGTLIYSREGGLFQRRSSGATTCIAEGAVDYLSYYVKYGLEKNNGHFLPDGTGYWFKAGEAGVDIYYYDGKDSVFVTTDANGRTAGVTMTEKTESIFCSQLIYKDKAIPLDGYDVYYAQTDGDRVVFVASGTLYTGRLTGEDKVTDITRIADNIAYHWGMQMTSDGGICYIGDADTRNYTGNLYYWSPEGTNTLIAENVRCLFPFDE